MRQANANTTQSAMHSKSHSTIEPVMIEQSRMLEQRRRDAQIQMQMTFRVNDGRTKSIRYAEVRYELDLILAKPEARDAFLLNLTTSLLGVQPPCEPYRELLAKPGVRNELLAQMHTPRCSSRFPSWKTQRELFRADPLLRRGYDICELLDGALPAAA